MVNSLLSSGLPAGHTADLPLVLDQKNTSRSVAQMFAWIVVLIYSAVCSLLSSSHCHGFSSVWTWKEIICDVYWTWLHLKCPSNVTKKSACDLLLHYSLALHTNASEVGVWPQCDSIDSSTVNFSVYLKANKWALAAAEPRTLSQRHFTASTLSVWTESLHIELLLTPSDVMYWLSHWSGFVAAKIFMAALRQKRKSDMIHWWNM